MNLKSSRLFTGLVLVLIMAGAVWGLLPRLAVERADRTVAILVDFREVLPLARQAGVSVEEALSMLRSKGARGLMVSELTGDDISHGLSAASLSLAREGTRSVEGTVVSILPDAPNYDLLSEWMRRRLLPLPLPEDTTDTTRVARRGPLLLPLPMNMFKTIGIVPDIDGLEAAKKLGFEIFYRPAPSWGSRAANAAYMLERVSEKYPVAVFAPSGEIVSGYPDVSGLASVSKEKNIPVALVEFSRQIGAPALNWKAAPLLLPLHSVTNEEMTARGITRKALRERLVRAAVERSVRLLLLRTTPQNMGNFTLQDFADETEALAHGLEARGFVMGWPEPVFKNLKNYQNDWRPWLTNFITAWALAAALFLSLWRYAARMSEKNILKGPVCLAGFAAGSLVLAVVMLKLNAIARLAGALAAPMITTDAALTALDFDNKNKKNPGLLSGLAKAVFIALAGGLAVASFFSTPEYMLRLQTFSGVKLTLMLPPLLVLLHDFKRRVHPESLRDILSRPPLWGELALCGVLLGGLGLMVFRSGNVAFIPGFEASVRESLERWLVARPRTKEVFLGYPSLLLLGFLVKNNLWARYREVLRVGVSLGFSSVVNSFCHFHTPLALILLREFNGLWTGLLLGVAAVMVLRRVLMPAARLARPLIH